MPLLKATRPSVDFARYSNPCNSDGLIFGLEGNRAVHNGSWQLLTNLFSFIVLAINWSSKPCILKHGEEKWNSLCLMKYKIKLVRVPQFAC